MSTFTSINGSAIQADSIGGNNGAFAWQRLSLSVAGNSNVTLSAAQQQNNYLDLTGALTGNIQVIIPLTAGAFWLVYNNTSGNFTVTVIGASGTGQVVTQGKHSPLKTDGVNVYPWNNDPFGTNAPPFVNRVVVAMTADANQTLTWAQAANRIIEIAGGTTLTATRNILLPDNTVREFVVYNNASGAQSLQFIGQSGTGITVATGKRAILYMDGTNVQRLTADL